MTLDIIIYTFIAILVVAACYGIPRIKGVWMIVALLYCYGCAMSSFATCLVFYLVLHNTRYIVISAVIGFFIWTILFIRLFVQNKFSVRDGLGPQ